MVDTKVKISKKQANELAKQLQQDKNFIPYKGEADFYYSFIEKQGKVHIKLYQFGKDFYLEITTLS
ncbi:hypothetical protein CCL42_gp01 [Sulfolobus islandicus rod-shaped virus 8]|uniref:Uncharacterized protein n=2 Tax=Usarudivirus TaxID=2843109 RepID=A0A1X9SJJ5_9VIRU|nr:hypothetical protein CCL41_gp58 [Sulfolobus islandicus rod-shaped virus 9]YP_009362674.1 hypothetical protein CCL42_gp01 [Sulfolobus islandicus rod-shaped virus 8]ARQ96406.1 hypothetical protein [Sulfolobus islandicus rod-shaped virus 9]ARQ96407.1 hypothetical protein [Sulfolobus islandicus rod-shaped virus 8]